MEALKVVLIALSALLMAAVVGAFNGSNGSYVAWGLASAIAVLLVYIMVRR